MRQLSVPRLLTASEKLTAHRVSFISVARLSVVFLVVGRTHRRQVPTGSTSAQISVSVQSADTGRSLSTATYSVNASDVTPDAAARQLCGVGGVEQLTVAETRN